MEQDRTAVLVMSYGTPESMDQIEAYYTHIRRGIPPTREQLQDLTARYEAIVGGFFPLRKNTDHQVASLQSTLNKSYPDSAYRCFQGLKHASPYIEDGVQAMVEAGYTRAVGIVLAPHYSIMSVGSYIQRAQAMAEKLDLPIRFVKSYHDHPLLIEMFATRILDSLGVFPEERRDQVRVIFTAHSLPERILEMNDPYPAQLLETSLLIANRIGLTNWQFAWQSAGQTEMPWLGPDILDVLGQIHKEQGVDQVILCPIGFVSDHLEVLYDIDIECKERADQLGMQLARTEMLNSDLLYMRLLAELVHQQANQFHSPPFATHHFYDKNGIEMNKDDRSL